MALQRSQTPIHWSYFLALEDDLYDLARYVDFSEPNYLTYSIEIARLLLSASAEVDSILKQLTKRQNDTNRADSIRDYFVPVTRAAPKFVNFKVSMPRYGIDFHPWSDWQENSPPIWWSAHNQVKHHRHSQFEQATLKNCLNSMAVLLIAVVHLHADEGKEGLLVGIPKLFSIPPDMGGGQRWGALGHSQLFYLNDEDNPFLAQNEHPP